MRSFKHYLLILTISLLPLLSFFLTPDMPHTHDGPVHLARMAAYYKELTSGQILPRWASELNYGYGLPLFNFMYHTPYLVASIPLGLGAGLVFSFKVVLLTSFLLSGIFMFLFTRTFLKDDNKALIASFLYQFAPFHLVELVVRGSIGEAYTYAFLPLTLYGILRTWETKKMASILLTAAGAALLILSHNAISLVFFGVVILFIVFLAPDGKRRLLSLISLSLGLALTAFYWIPAMLERKYTYGDLFMREMYKTHFPPIWQFFIPNFANSTWWQTGGVAVGFGFLQTIALAVALYLLFIRKIAQQRTKRLVLFALSLITLSLFFMQPVSRIFWERIPTLRMFQFPWRLLSVVIFATALLAVVLIPSMKRVKTSRLMILILLAVIPTLVYFRPPLGFDKIDETYFWNYLLNTTYFGETDLVWSAGPANSYPLHRIEIIEGEADLKELTLTGASHRYTITALTPVRIVDRTQYFPGWRVYANEEKIPIEFQDQNWRGLITFRLPPGRHVVNVAFGESPVRLMAEMVSLATLAFLSFWFLIKRGDTRKT